MNERIKELAAKSGWRVRDDGDIQSGYREDADLSFELEEFAVRIIKSCVKIADDNFDKGFCPVGGFIKEHFGVE